MKNKILFFTICLFLTHSCFGATNNTQNPIEELKDLIGAEIILQAVEHQKKSNNAFNPEDTTAITLYNFIVAQNLDTFYTKLSNPSKQSDFKNFFQKQYKMSLNDWFMQFDDQNFKETLAQSLQQKYKNNLKTSRTFIKIAEAVFNSLSTIAETLQKFQLSKKIIELENKLETNQQQNIEEWTNSVNAYLATLTDQDQRPLNSNCAEHMFLKNGAIKYLTSVGQKRLNLR